MPLNIIQTEEGATGWAIEDQARFIAIKAFVDALETDIDEFPDELKLLTQAEIQQLENIGAVTISPAQWGYVGAQDQGIASGDSVTFDDVAITNPVNIFTAMDTRYYTEDEVDEIIAGAIFGFWPSDTPDGVLVGYNRIFDADTEEIKSSIGPVTIDVDKKIIQNFVTAIGEPDFTVLSEGVFALDIHASSTVGANIKDARIKWELWKRTHPAGAETLLVESESGEVLTNAEVHYTIHGTLAEETVLDTTDRLVLKIYGLREGAKPQNPDVTIFMEGDTSTRIEVRTNLTAFDNRYLRVGGQNAMEADLPMGGHAITNVGNVDGVDVAALKVDIDEFPDELKLLTQVEIQQLENIGAVTISPAQWNGLGSSVRLWNLTDAEIQQLEAIGGTTISATQWGYLGAQTGRVGLVDRGDPAAWDFTLVNFVTDGTWREKDFSAIVPAGAKGVLLQVQVLDNLVGKSLQFRNADHVNSHNNATILTMVANVSTASTMPISISTDRKLDYRASNIAWTSILVVVLGWWFE